MERINASVSRNMLRIRILSSCNSALGRDIRHPISSTSSEMGMGELHWSRREGLCGILVLPRLSAKSWVQFSACPRTLIRHGSLFEYAIIFFKSSKYLPAVVWGPRLALMDLMRTLSAVIIWTVCNYGGSVLQNEVLRATTLDRYFFFNSLQLAISALHVDVKSLIEILCIKLLFCYIIDTSELPFIIKSIFLQLESIPWWVKVIGILSKLFKVLQQIKYKKYIALQKYYINTQSKVGLCNIIKI